MLTTSLQARVWEVYASLMADGEFCKRILRWLRGMVSIPHPGASALPYDGPLRLLRNCRVLPSIVQVLRRFRDIVS